MTWSTNFSAKSEEMLCSVTCVQAVSSVLWIPVMSTKYSIYSLAASHHRMPLCSRQDLPWKRKPINSYIENHTRHFNLRILLQFSLKYLRNTAITLIFNFDFFYYFSKHRVQLDGHRSTQKRTFKKLVPIEWETVTLLAENSGRTDSFEMTTYLQHCTSLCSGLAVLSVQIHRHSISGDETSS